MRNPSQVVERASAWCVSALDAVVRRAARMPDWLLGVIIFVPVLVIYVSTSTTSIANQTPDGVAAAIPAWHWAAYHTLFLDHHRPVQNLWVGKISRHWVSNRQPGVVFFGIPFYLVLDRSPHFSMFPAVVAAGFAAAGAATFMTLTVRRVLDTRLALLTGVIFAFGTATWSVSADTLWPHGPDQLFLALAMYFFARHRNVAASIAIATCVPTRAHLAVVAAVAGIYLLAKHRSVKDFAIFALPSLVALELLSLYNHWMFGTWSLDGGYSPYATENIVGVGHSSWLLTFLRDILGSFISLDRGIIIWCPIAVVLTVGLRAAWRQSPEWVHMSAIGGVAYYLIQMKISFFSGGDRFWSYRVILESLTLVTPLLAYAARDVLARRNAATRLLSAAAIYCVGTQAVGAIFYVPDLYHHSPWTHSKLAQILVHGGLGPRIIMALTTVGVVAAIARPRRTQAGQTPRSDATATNAPAPHHEALAVT